MIVHMVDKVKVGERPDPGSAEVVKGVDSTVSSSALINASQESSGTWPACLMLAVTSSIQP